MSELFEADVKSNTPEETQPPVKTKKARKPLSEERKAQLREQLKRGREASLEKRRANKQSKTLKKIKEEESVVRPSIQDRLRTDVDRERELEERLTDKISKRLQKQQEEKEKERELLSLRAELAELKKPKTVKVVEKAPEPVRPPEPVAAPTPTRPVYSKFSPHRNHFML
jgi:hypothetical protein